MAQNESYIKRLVAAVRGLSLAKSQVEVMAIVRRVARELSGADGVAFVIRDGHFCFYADEDAVSPLWKGQRFPIDICVSGWVMQHRQVVAIADIYQDPRVPIDAYRPTFVKSLAMAPICTEAPIGAIGAYWAHRHQPSNAEIDLLQTLADASSVAMENMQLQSSLESRLRDLDRSNRAKDEFLETLSHELRTPLNAILGWADLFTGGALESHEYQEGGAAIARNAYAQARTIDQLLDTTRIVSGTLSLTKKSLDLCKIAAQAVGSRRLEAAQKALTVELRLPESAIGTMLGDEARLNQVLGHLLANAIKFTAAGGHIRVVVAREGPNARIDISDSGVGITAEALPMIFDRFQQADGSTTRRFGGLGLGLSIAKHLVEAHGGQLEATSPGLGAGATFSVKLPLAALPQGHGRGEASSAGKLLAGLRILAVDDEPDVRQLVGFILRRHGAEVSTASLASEAFLALESFQPHLLLCDLSMPEEDGYSLIRRIRAAGFFNGGRLPAVALTAFADNEHETRALNAGFDAFMPKPLHAVKLAATLSNLHKSRLAVGSLD